MPKKGPKLFQFPLTINNFLLNVELNRNPQFITIYLCFERKRKLFFHTDRNFPRAQKREEKSYLKILCFALSLPTLLALICCFVFPFWID